jgi:hypothetical protein
MPKAYKPLDETSGRNRPCLRCFNCNTQTFRDLNKLNEFCKKRELHLSYAWEKRLIKDKVLKLYWCTKSQTKPRIFRFSDVPFIVHCKHFNGGDIDGNI